MNLLDKFDHIEIKIDERISESDKVFCKANEKAYDLGIDAVISMGNYAKGFRQQQIDALAGLFSEDALKYRADDYLCNGFHADDYQNSIISIHRKYIDNLVGYFEEKYHVSIDKMGIADFLIPKKPEVEICPVLYKHLDSWTDEDADRVRKANDERKKLNADYEESIRRLRISYTSVLDQIFLQIGGSSFSDAAISELKSSCHMACWYQNSGEPKFEQKKAVVLFTGYGCNIDHIHEKYKSKNDPSYFEVSEDMKKVLRALNYYETGTQRYTLPLIDKLCGYHVDCPDYDIGGEKIKGIKLYKNGRVEIRFQSESYARQFVEQFMGTVA